MPAYVALLRGINVGGKRPVRMPDLVDCVAAVGHHDVRTYLQSGNVLFTARALRAASAEATLESALVERFGFEIPVVLRSLEQMAQTVAMAPAGHGGPDLRSDVIFVKRPLTAAEAFAQLPPLREGVDSVALGPDAIYFSRVAELASRTRMTKIISMPMYQSMTVRNWNTVTRVHAMLEAMAAGG